MSNPDTPTRNTERLRRLADVLEEHGANFDMRNFFGHKADTETHLVGMLPTDAARSLARLQEGRVIPETCGTTACAAGWEIAIAVADGDLEEIEVANLDYVEFAAHRLGLNGHESIALFCPFGISPFWMERLNTDELSDVRATDVADVLRLLADNQINLNIEYL